MLLLANISFLIYCHIHHRYFLFKRMKSAYFSSHRLHFQLVTKNIEKTTISFLDKMRFRQNVFMFVRGIIAHSSQISTQNACQLRHWPHVSSFFLDKLRQERNLSIFFCDKLSRRLKKYMSLFLIGSLTFKAAQREFFIILVFSYRISWRPRSGNFL